MKHVVIDFYTDPENTTSSMATFSGDFESITDAFKELQSVLNTTQFYYVSQIIVDGYRV